MILIFSQSFEPSTDAVIEWLIAMNKKFIRINYDTDFVKSVDFDMSDTELDYTKFDDFHLDQLIDKFLIHLLDGRIINLKNITSVWYRRGQLPEYHFGDKVADLFQDELINNMIMSHLKNEYDAIIKIANNYLFRNKNIKVLSSPFKSSSNKIMNLIYARNFGIQTPSYKIVSKKDDLLQTINNQKTNRYISKSIDEMLIQGAENLRLVSYTEVIDEQKIRELDECFFPSCIQLQIIKKADIRTVFIDDNFYSIAIFSQKNERTTVDFRKYDEFNPNRSVTFKLPEDIEDRLRRLLMLLQYTFCSIDLIWDINNQFYFLEINPVGQFGMVSYPGNYHIEKKIAEIL